MLKLYAAVVAVLVPSALGVFGDAQPDATFRPVAVLAPALASAPASVSADSLDDATIVAIFDAANTADIETASLAAQRGRSKEVRQLGAQFAHDHRAVRQQGHDLAKRLGVTPTPPKNDKSAVEHARVMRLLRSKHGTAFDRAWAQHEVAYHQAVIDAVTHTLLPSIHNPELKAFVEKVAPAFQAHLLAAQQLAAKVAN